MKLTKPMVFIFAALIASAVQAQTNSAITTTNRIAAKAEPSFQSSVSHYGAQNLPLVREVKPNEIVVGRVAFEGIAVEATKRRNLFQLINPFAPADYGSAADNTVFDPINGRSSGLKIFQLKF